MPADAPVTVVVSETGPAGAVARTLMVDGAPVPLTATGEATVSASAFGRHELLATVTDPYDSDDATGEFFVIDPSDITPPVVDITTPLDTSEVTAPTPVRITVTDARLRDWKLNFRESNTDKPPTFLAQGLTEQTDQVAAHFDPTQLLNGQYTLYLLATDLGGNQSTDSAVLRVTGDMKIGNFSPTFEEVSIPVAGIPVIVSWIYETNRQVIQRCDGASA